MDSVCMNELMDGRMKRKTFGKIIREAENRETCIIRTFE